MSQLRRRDALTGDVVDEVGAEHAAFLTDYHPLDYFRVFYRRRWLMAAIVVAAGAGVAAYNAMVTPLYEATSTVLIESDRPSVVSFPEVLNEGLAQDGYYQTQLQLLTSRSTAQRTARALPEATRAALGGTSEDAAIAAILDRLSVNSLRGTRMVNLRFRSPDPAVAAEVANVHARQYIEQSLDTRFTASKEATEWLDAQLTEERARVERSDSALQAYREQHDAVALGPGQDIVVQKLGDLNAAVTRAKTERIEKEARYRGMVALQREAGAIEAFPAILANAFVQQLKGNLATLQRERSQLAETLGDRHPTLVAKDTEVATTERRLAAEITRVVDSVSNEYRAAQSQEAGMVAALEAQKREALALNRRGIEYAALQREAESVRQVYQSLLQRAKETSISADLRASNIRIIDAARTPTTPVTPRSAFNLLIGLLGGSLLAVGLVCGLEYVDDRTRTPDDVQRRLRLRVVGLIPEVRGRKGNPGAALLDANPRSSLVESVRAIRTALLSAADGPGPHSVVVASASEGEGKSFVASNLAIALAQAHQRVLLIDADMRRPGVHTLFAQALEPGLSGLLQGDAALAEVPATDRGARAAGHAGGSADLGSTGPARLAPLRRAVRVDAGALRLGDRRLSAGPERDRCDGGGLSRDRAGIPGRFGPHLDPGSAAGDPGIADFRRQRAGCRVDTRRRAAASLLLCAVYAGTV